MKPYVCLKAAISLDGYLDDSTSKRLILSNELDRQSADLFKSEFDAILVGAETIRKDNPSLLIKAPHLVESRSARGLSSQPIKVTLTRTAAMDPQSRFFQEGDQEKIIYCPENLLPYFPSPLQQFAKIVGLPGTEVNPAQLLSDLHSKGVRRLLIEGGGQIHRLFLLHDLVDEIRVAIAPFFIADPKAPKFVAPALLPQCSARRMDLTFTERLGDMVILHYKLKRAI